MPTVGTINIDLRMGTAAVVSGANKAAGSIAAMAKSIVGSIKSIGTSIVPTVSVEGILGGLKNLATAASTDIDRVAKLSDRLGISTEALVGMGHAADLAGVSSEEFGGMLEKLQKNIGVANEDGGKTIDVLKGLGLNMRDISQQNIGETFMQIADAVEKIPDPTKRAQVMFELFGRSGQQLTNTMLGGGKSMREAMAEAQRLGMTFSRLDASKVEAANDAFTRLKGAILGVGNTITIGLAPFVEGLNKTLTALVATKGQDFGKMIVDSFVMIVDVIQLAHEGLLRFGATLGTIASKMGQMIEGMGNNKWIGNQAMRDSGKEMDIAGQTFAMGMNDKADKAAASPRWSKGIIDAANAAAKDVVSQLAKSTITEQVFGGLFKSFDALKSKGVEAGSAIAKAFSPLADKLREAGKATTERFMNPMEKFKKEQDDLDRQLRAGVINQETYNRATAANAQTLQGPAAVVQTASATAGGTVAANNRFAQAYNEGLNGQAAGKGKGFADIFREAQKQSAIQQRMDDNLAEQVAIWRGINVGVIP